MANAGRLLNMIFAVSIHPVTGRDLEEVWLKPGTEIANLEEGTLPSSGEPYWLFDVVCGELRDEWLEPHKTYEKPELK